MQAKCQLPAEWLFTRDPDWAGGTVYEDNRDKSGDSPAQVGIIS